MPSPGKITRLKEPSGPGVRLDSGVYEGWNVPMEYDPLLAKLVTWAPSRELATARMQRALREYVIGGIRTNREFFAGIFNDENFRAGRLTTAFLDGFFERRQASLKANLETDLETEAVAALVTALASRESPLPLAASKNETAKSMWSDSGRSAQLR